MLYIQLRSQNINKKNTQIHINLHYNKASEQINITAQNNTGAHMIARTKPFRQRFCTDNTLQRILDFTLTL